MFLCKMCCGVACRTMPVHGLQRPVYGLNRTAAEWTAARAHIGAAALGAARISVRVWRRTNVGRFDARARVAREGPRHAGLLLLLGQQEALSEIQRLERSEHLLELAATRRSAAVRAATAVPSQQLRQRDGHRRRGELRNASQSACHRLRLLIRQSATINIFAHSLRSSRNPCAPTPVTPSPWTSSATATLASSSSQICTVRSTLPAQM